ncbi:MAG: hypothetical protein R6U26_01655 [Candidatus Undinarchaeales archaeon]
MPATAYVAQLSGAIYDAIVMPVLTSFWSIVISAILLVLGYVIGKVVGAAVKEVLMRFKIDSHVEIKQEELKLSNIFSEVIKWIIYLLFISQAAEVLNITIVATAMNSLVLFLPRILAGIIIISVGYVIARYVEDIVGGSKFAYSGLMAKVFFFFVVYLSIAIGLNALNTAQYTLIDPTLINNILLIIVGAVGFGFAIAMGLGLKTAFKKVGNELGKSMVKSLKAKKKKHK